MQIEGSSGRRGEPFQKTWFSKHGVFALQLGQMNQVFEVLIVLIELVIGPLSVLVCHGCQVVLETESLAGLKGVPAMTPVSGAVAANNTRPVVSRATLIKLKVLPVSIGKLSNFLVKSWARGKMASGFTCEALSSGAAR
jgi:hypothetical protein